MVDWPIALSILCVVTLAAAVQALSGFGFALVLVPFASALIGPKETVILASLLALALNGLQTLRLREFIRPRPVSFLTGGSVLGMPAGLGILLFADPSVVKTATGAAVLIATALLGTGVRFPASKDGGDIVAGLVSGLLNTSTGISGPPVAIYFHGRMPPLEFRATIAAFFLVSAAAGLVLLALATDIKGEVVMLSLACIPLVAAGSAAGNALSSSTSAALFRRLVLVILALSGLTALVAGLIELRL